MRFSVLLVSIFFLAKLVRIKNHNRAKETDDIKQNIPGNGAVIPFGQRSFEPNAIER